MPQQVKAVDNGRYAITENEKTEYYSHDGKKLRMDYVTADTKELKQGYKKKLAVNGKTSWYYDRQGKPISKNKYFSEVLSRDVKFQNGKFIYQGEEIPAKPCGNGIYTVTIGGDYFNVRIAKKDKE